MRKKTSRVIGTALMAAALSVAVLTGCQKDDGNQPQPQNPPVVTETDSQQGSSDAGSEASGKETENTGAGSAASGSEEGALRKAEDGAILASTMGEFLDAIAPGATIRFDVNSINMSLWLNNMSKQDQSVLREWNRNHPYVAIHVDEYYGADFVIKEVSDLTLEGLEGRTELAIECQYLDVLNFDHCNNLTLRNLSVGHIAPKGSCMNDAVQLNYGKNIRFENVDLYGCGCHGLAAENVAGLTIVDSVLRDCSDGLLDLNGVTNAVVENTEMKTSDAYPLLSLLATEITFRNCDFHDNSINYRYCDGLIPERVSFEGCHFDEGDSKGLSDLRMKYPQCFSDCTFDAPIEVSDPKVVTEVTVSSMEELLEAIAPNRKITVKKGRYCQSDVYEAMSVKQLEDWNAAHEYVSFDEVFDGYEVRISGVYNLTIQGETSDPLETEIVTNPRYSTLFLFDQCSDISISGLSIGHVEAGSCSGDVLSFNGCQEVSLDNMDLYGCGVTGILLEDVSNMVVKNSIVRDCSWSSMSLCGFNYNISFLNTNFYGTGTFGYATEYSYSGVSFDHCNFGDGESDVKYVLENATFVACTFI